EDALAGYERLWRPVVARRQRAARRIARWFVPETPRQQRLRRAALHLAGLPGAGRIAGAGLVGGQRPLLSRLAAVPARASAGHARHHSRRSKSAQLMVSWGGQPPSRGEVQMPSSPRPGPSAVAARLREALRRADCRLLAEVLHANVHWSPPGGGGTGCHARSHVLSRCSRLHALGLRADIEETFTYPAAVVLGLRIHGTVPPADPDSVAYHVFHVAAGLITRITCYADRAQALDAAFTGTTGRPWRWPPSQPAVPPPPG
ncbi:nuclear transport factor 2 family protein, partial [Streptomyces sp. NPDC048386]|uniref:nuclear transport factor 2 family protein n=1 Tax=Streptomyces sp. NPDC048386 TaxID=3365541 RepID=UPI003721E505